MFDRASESPRSDFAGPKASQQRLRRAASGPCRKAAKGKVGRLRLPVPQGSEAALSCLGPDFRLCPGEDSPRRATTSTTRLACSRHRHPSPSAGSAMARHPSVLENACTHVQAPATPRIDSLPALRRRDLLCLRVHSNRDAWKVPGLQTSRPHGTAPCQSGTGKPDESPGPQGGRRATEELCEGAWMGPSFGGWDRQGGGRGSCAGWDCALAQRLAQMLAEGSDAWMRTPAFWAVPG